MQGSRDQSRMTQTGTTKPLGAGGSNEAGQQALDCDPWLLCEKA